MPKWTVSARDRDLKIPNFLQKKLKTNDSLRSIKKSIENHHLKVNGKVERFASRPLQKGDVVEFALGFTEQKSKALFEDEHLLIIDKPAYRTSEEKNFPHPPAHRLDKNTTGVLILAKSLDAKKAMEHLFRERKVQKTYHALVDGKVKEEGRIESKIAKKEEGIFGSSEKGALAITHFKILEKNDQASFLEIQPETGRTHQIRVHFKEKGHSVLGDHQYARSFRCKLFIKRTLLHASAVQFIHPMTGEELFVSAPLPEDFQKTLKILLMTHEVELFR